MNNQYESHKNGTLSMNVIIYVLCSLCRFLHGSSKNYVTSMMMTTVTTQRLMTLVTIVMMMSSTRQTSMTALCPPYKSTKTQLMVSSMKSSIFTSRLKTHRASSTKYVSDFSNTSKIPYKFVCVFLAISCVIRSQLSF